MTNKEQSSYIISEDKIRWEDDYSIFAKEDYLRLDAHQYGWIYGYKNNILKYIIPYKVFKKLFFLYVQFQTSCIQVDRNVTLNDEKEFLNEVVNYLRDKDFDFIIAPPNYAIFNTIPDNSAYCEFGTYVVDLTKQEKELFDNLHQKHRNVIRNAEKKGIKVVRGYNYINVAYNLYAQTLSRSGLKPISYTKFFNIVNSIKDNIEIFIAYYDNIAQGAAVIPYSKYSAYYIFGGSIDKPLTGAVNYLHWKAMCYFKSLGVKYYDFVGARLQVERGSKYEGIQRFKERFGGELRRGYIWKIVLNPFKFNFYKALRILLRKWQPDIIDQLTTKRS